MEIKTALPLHVSKIANISKIANRPHAVWFSKTIIPDALGRISFTFENCGVLTVVFPPNQNCFQALASGDLGFVVKSVGV